jgi:lipopolysaccharide export system permease protein
MFKIKLIDRYILGKFFTTFVYVALVTNAVICVIDYGEKSENFLKHKLPAWFVVRHYYFNLIPSYTNMLSPIFVFITSIFVTARLAARTEIVAILASGVSFMRLLAPYTVGAVILGLVAFASTGWLVPRASRTHIAFENEFIRDREFYDKRNVHFKIAPGTFAYFESYDNWHNTGFVFTLETLEGNRMTAKLAADQIKWDSLKQKWHIDRYKVHHFDGDRERIEEGYGLDTTLALKPKDFASTHRLHETLTLPQLDEYIKEQTERGNTALGIYLVEKYERYAYPWAMIILTFMGVIVTARKSRQGTGFQVAVGIALAFLFITLVRIFRSVGQAGTIEPMVAAWMPTVMFAGVALLLYKTVPR